MVHVRKQDVRAFIEAVRESKDYDADTKKNIIGMVRYYLGNVNENDYKVKDW